MTPDYGRERRLDPHAPWSVIYQRANDRANNRKVEMETARERFIRMVQLELSVDSNALEEMQLDEELAAMLSASHHRTYHEVKDAPPLIEGITQEEHELYTFSGAMMAAFWAGYLWRGMKDAERSAAWSSSPPMLDDLLGDG